MARLALLSGAPVIPVAVTGTDKVQPLGQRLPRLHRVVVRFGHPREFNRYEGMAGSGFMERSLTDQLMYELMLLSGQEYVDVYATKAKADEALSNGLGAPMR